jgi:hypothetical protein
MLVENNNIKNARPVRDEILVKLGNHKVGDLMDKLIRWAIS